MPRAATVLLELFIGLALTATLPIAAYAAAIQLFHWRDDVTTLFVLLPLLGFFLARTLIRVGRLLGPTP